MKWWNIIKETGAVLSTTAGIDSKPKYSDDEEEEIEKVIGFVAGKVIGGKKNGEETTS
tara:strand:+ start:429 stop:602 length:174 start_codon:yes stop_codon:yes gene_type:complete